MTAVAETTTRTPWHVWVVGVLAVLFNAYGVYDHSMNLIQGSAYMADAGMTPAQIAHYEAMPAWMNVDWAVGVWSALVGSLLILLRNRLAAPVFALSLAAYLLSVAYNYLMSDGGAIMGQQMAIMSCVITGFLVAFLAYSAVMAKRGVLR